MAENLTLTQNEIDERTAILKRLRHLLEQQRIKFKEYLHLLEQQEQNIKTENVEAVSAQAELEQSIVTNIINLQRVIKPMEDLYRSVYPKDEEHIPQMRADLEKLQNQVLIQNEHNRELIKTNIVQIRNQISKIKNPYAKRKSIYAADVHTASFVDVSQ